MKDQFEEKYLGLPTPEGRMHKGRFQNLQVKLMKRICIWGDGYMAQAGREVLIKAVAQSIPTYIMGVFKLPFSVCDDLTRMVRNYWWGSEKGKRKTYWMEWENIIKPKAMGGLGFKDYRLFNQALLAKQAWRLLDRPDSLCARLIKARYYPSGQLLDTVFPGTGLEVWKGILHGLEQIKKGGIWRVGNGTKIRTWRDPWLPRPYSFRPLTLKGNFRFNWVADFLDGNGAWRQDRLASFSGLWMLTRY